MKFRKNISLAFTVLMLGINTAGAAATSNVMNSCMKKIAKSNETFTVPLKNLVLVDGQAVDKQIVKQNKSQILGLIAANVAEHCWDYLPQIAQEQEAKLSFQHNNKKYAFQFQIAEMFEYIDIPTGIMVYDKRDKAYDDEIKVDDINKIYWSDACSDHVVWDDLNNKAAVNVAGQKVFKAYGGSDNEFFLDFNKGNSMRSFPGLVIMDETASREEKIVSFRNFLTGIQAAQKFAAALKDTACTNQNLAVYLVSLKDAKDRRAISDWRQWVSIAYYHLGGFLIPTQLQEIPQVTVMAGPFNI